MKKTKIIRFLSLFLVLVLVAATTLLFAGCGDKNEKTEAKPETAYSSSKKISPVVMGEGKTVFDFTVKSENGENAFEIHTDKTVVGDALSELGLIDGEEGEYGLYVKTVNGIVADYNADGTYWAFYINGEYASGGVDTTEIVPGTSYMLAKEK